MLVRYAVNVYLSYIQSASLARLITGKREISAAKNFHGISRSV